MDLTRIRLNAIKNRLTICMTILPFTETTACPGVAKGYQNVEECNPGTKTSKDHKEFCQAGIQSDMMTEKINPVENRTPIAMVEESKRFKEWEIDALINYIISNCHIPAKQKAVLIYDLADRTSRECGAKHPELLRLTTALFLFFDDLLRHLKVEEQVLFPNMLQLNKKIRSGGLGTYTTFGFIKSSSNTMHEGHDAIIESLKSFRGLTNDYKSPSDASGSHHRLLVLMKEFENDLILQLYLENNILFPKAIEMDERTVGYENL
jgi:regulator of cell morphogenesis and NO signaling